MLQCAVADPRGARTCPRAMDRVTPVSRQVTPLNPPNQQRTMQQRKPWRNLCAALLLLLLVGHCAYPSRVSHPAEPHSSADSLSALPLLATLLPADAQVVLEKQHDMDAVELEQPQVAAAEHSSLDAAEVEEYSFVEWSPRRKRRPRSRRARRSTCSRATGWALTRWTAEMRVAV